MKCLCCGKDISSTSESELNYSWHFRCIKSFFGTKQMPIINVSNESLKMLAYETINKGYTVTGVQKKLSLHLSDEKYPRLTMVNYPTGYILKPQVEEFKCMPECEDLIMRMADISGIKTVPHALIYIDEKQIAYITKRIDRFDDEGKQVILAMEDFCQIEGRLTLDKYKGSYEKCAKVVETYSNQYGLDMAELFLIIVFSFVVGNSDMHLKNFSLIETYEGSREYKLSAAYDLLPVNVLMPEDSEELALTLNSKKRKIKRDDFIIFAENSGLSKKVAEKLIGKIVSLADTYYKMCDESMLSEDLKESLKELIKDRIYRLSV